ncbi:MAG: hypothetical protein RBU37_11495 [Myxococcota bacterium]|jgi:hypothetical protein|nr:hypothetical protein [Myxococcota bacterium]
MFTDTVRQIRNLLVLVALAAVMVLVNFFTVGCEEEEEKDTASDTTDVQSDQPADIPKDCQTLAYYGPQPCDNDAECVSRHGEGWYCADNTFDDGCGGTISWPSCQEGDTPDLIDDVPVVYYGPQPDVMDTDDIPSYYGPQPDFVDSEDTPPDLEVEDVPAYYGPQPIDQTEDCTPATWYGPPPCEADQECQDAYGPTWYCDQEATVVDSCGNTVAAPSCAER